MVVVVVVVVVVVIVVVVVTFKQGIYNYSPTRSYHAWDCTFCVVIREYCYNQGE